MVERARRAPGRWAGRALRTVGLTLVGLWGLYLLAMNVFVRTRLFRDLIGADPSTILVEYASAYSLVPGRIHVRDLRIRGRDSNVEWILVIDRCDFRVVFGDFLHRRFHADHVHGDGVSFRVRLREPTFTQEHAAALPPVPGFADPPYSGDKPPPLSDADYHLWSVWLEDVFAEHVREVWVDTMRLSGDLDIRGRWYFKPVRWLDVGPATLDLRTLDVSYGAGAPWVTGATGRLVTTVHLSDVRLYEGPKVLDFISASGDLAGTLRAEEPLRHLVADGDVVVDRADGPFTVHAVVDHGVLRPGTTVALGPLPVRARGFGLDAASDLGASARVDADGVGRAVFDVRRVRVSQAAFLRAEVDRVTADAQTRKLDLTRPFGDASYAADVEGLSTDSIRYWSARFAVAPRVAIDSGRVTVRAHVEGAVGDSATKGSVHLQVQGLSMAAHGAAARGDLVVDVDGTAHSRGGRFTLTRAGVALTDVRLEAGGAAVLVPRATLASSGGVVTPERVEGLVDLDVPDVEVPDVGEVASLFPLPPTVGVQGGRARGRMSVRVDLGDGAADGTADLTARGVTVCVGSRRSLHGDLTVSLLARRKGEVTDVSQTRVRFQDSQEDGWWASAQLLDARLEVRRGPRLTAHVALSAKDASPVVTLLRDQADFPEKIALGLVSTSGLSAGGEILLEPSVLEARSVVAHTDGFDLQLELATLGREHRLAALVVAGPVHLGVDLANEATNVRLFGADPWFTARVASIRAEEEQAD